jgi:hypothetical protein
VRKRHPAAACQPSRPASGHAAGWLIRFADQPVAPSRSRLGPPASHVGAPRADAAR